MRSNTYIGKVYDVRGRRKVTHPRMKLLYYTEKDTSNERAKSFMWGGRNKTASRKRQTDWHTTLEGVKIEWNVSFFSAAICDNCISSGLWNGEDHSFFNATEHVSTLPGKGENSKRQPPEEQLLGVVSKLSGLAITQDPSTLWIPGSDTGKWCPEHLSLEQLKTHQHDHLLKKWL